MFRLAKVICETNTTSRILVTHMVGMLEDILLNILLLLVPLVLLGHV